MDPSVPVDVRELHDALEAAERDAQSLVAGLAEELGTRRLAAGSWSVAECLDHLATGNRVYLSAMLDPAKRARADGRYRRGPANPGWAGRLFVYQLEPPPSWWSTPKAPRKIRPRTAPPLAEAFSGFMEAWRVRRALERAGE